MSLQTAINASGLPSVVTTSYDPTATPAVPIPVSTQMTFLSNAGVVNITATPSVQTSGIASGTRFTILQTGAGSTVLTDDGTLAGTKLKLQSATRTLSADKSLVLVFNGTYWCEEAFSSAGVGVTNVTASAPISSSGGATPNIAFTVAPGTLGNVLTSDGAGNWVSAAGGGSTVTLAQQLWVAKNGNDVTGSGTLSAPYLTISKALTITNAGAANTYYRINVSPGTYTENLSITKQRTLIVGSSTAPEQLQTAIIGTVNINPTASTDRVSDVIGLSGLFFTGTTAGTAGITITGTQLFGVEIDNCYFTVNQTNSNVLFCDASNASRPVIVIRNTVLNKVTNGATVPVVRLDRGDCRMDTVRIYASITGAAEGVTLANNATLTADRILIDKNTSGAGISVNTAYAGISCSLTNCSITQNYTGAATSAALNLNNSLGVAGFVWQCLFSVLDTTANNAIDGTVNAVPTSPLIVGNLAFSPTTNTTITAAVNAAKLVMTVIP